MNIDFIMSEIGMLFEILNSVIVEIGVSHVKGNLFKCQNHQTLTSGLGLLYILNLNVTKHWSGEICILKCNANESPLYC